MTPAEKDIICSISQTHLTKTFCLRMVIEAGILEFMWGNSELEKQFEIQSLYCNSSEPHTAAFPWMWRVSAAVSVFLISGVQIRKLRFTELR